MRMRFSIDRWFVAPVSRFGADKVAATERLGRAGLFLLKSVFYVFVPPLKVFNVMKRIRFIGFDSLGVILMTGAFTGMVLSFQGFHQLDQVGSTAVLGSVVALSLLRELGPVLAALMVTGRAGSALAAEMGFMRNTEQIDALEMLGLNPYQYLVVPNLLGALVATPLLTAVFVVTGIFGGYLIGVPLLGVNGSTFFGSITDYTRVKDITDCMMKAFCFGGLIAWISSCEGFHTGFGAEGVSRATTRAVVVSSVLILAWDYFMTSVLF